MVIKGQTHEFAEGVMREKRRQMIKHVPEGVGAFAVHVEPRVLDDARVQLYQALLHVVHQRFLAL